MLDHDISTADALRLLSRTDDGPDVRGPAGWTRRAFLQAVGMGVAGGALVGTLGRVAVPGDMPRGVRRRADRAQRRHLDHDHAVRRQRRAEHRRAVRNGLYYDQRANIAIPPNQVLPIDSDIGLHPNLPYIKATVRQPARWRSCRASVIPIPTCRTSPRWPSG